MLDRFFDHSYIASTILFTVYSQLIMRWQVQLAGALPGDISGKMYYIAKLLINPWVLSGMLASFLAGVSWMLSMSKFEISYAYPFMSLNYLIVLAAGYMIFSESMSGLKLIGTILVISGLIVISKG